MSGEEKREKGERYEHRGLINNLVLCRWCWKGFGTQFRLVLGEILSLVN